MTKQVVYGIALGFAVACGGSSSDTLGPPPTPQVNDIGIQPNASVTPQSAFSPNPKTVSLAGAANVAVRWVNLDITGGDGYGGSGTAVVHRIVSDNGAFGDGPNMTGNQTFSATFSAVGAYPYHCSIHPTMAGTIQVTQ